MSKSVETFFFGVLQKLENFAYEAKIENAFVLRFGFIILLTSFVACHQVKRVIGRPTALACLIQRGLADGHPFLF